MSELALRLIEENKKTRAKFLDLGNCGLTEVPVEIGELVWLEGLSFSTEYLEEDKDKQTQNSEFENNIKWLVLPSSFSSSSCDRSTTNNPFASLKSLKKLWLSASLENTFELDDLSPIAGLVNLQELYISRTKVCDLSPLIEIQGLRILDISYTMVSNLYPLSKLSAIKQINATRSKVSDIYPLIKLIKGGIIVEWGDEAKAKECICVANCPLINPPAEVIKQGNDAILNFFKEKDVQGIDHLYEAKLLIVGEGGAGKTSLLRRLYQPEKPMPKVAETTKGIDIYRHEFIATEGRNFRLNVWDFGGQEIYHATHQFFLTKRSLYVLLDDTRKDHKTVQDKEFKYWLEVVDQPSEHSPVLIFQNEKGGRSKTIDEAGIKGHFSNVKDVFKGNLELNNSADKLRQALEYYANQLPHIGEELPKLWVAIRADIETLAKHKPYISQQEYFELYSQHLPFDRTKALHLSRYFHDLGVFLHFQDDWLLAKTVILQNTWATEAVFKMLDDETVKKALGRFTLQDCQRVWQDSVYADMHPELLALMQKFELCYPLQDAKTKTWLATQLLPPSKPIELAKWEQPGDLVLRYRYEFMPKGLISRLMVRKHRFVPQPDLGWVTGVLFERDGSQVLVEIPPKGGEIAMRARGSERKELLTVISDDLDALNSSFFGLKVDKLVPCICTECCSLFNPEYFEQTRLLNRKRDGRLEVECPRSYEKVNVLELLEGVREIKLPNWAIDHIQVKNQRYSKNRAFLYSINDKIAEQIRLLLQSYNIVCVNSCDDCTLYLVELIEDNSDNQIIRLEIVDKKILYYCCNDIDPDLPSNSTNNFILRYSCDSDDKFIDSLATWILINSEL